jgi:hypothetical protein
MRVLPEAHAQTAALLSLVTERPVWGVHNKTAGVYAGSVVDAIQCVLDYSQNASARRNWAKILGKPGRVPEAEIPLFLANLRKNYFVWNTATLKLFEDLVTHRHVMKCIIAHSQGNLITANALFILEEVLGSVALQKVRVYSMASPAPAWPVGLRKTVGGGGRQENAFMNDLVVLFRPHNLLAKLGMPVFQNQGDFRTDTSSWPVSLTPHDSDRILDTLNLVNSIRNDLVQQSRAERLTAEDLDRLRQIVAREMPDL